MKKNYYRKIILSIFFLAFTSIAGAQNVLVFAEDFETPSSSLFTLNTGGPSTATGVNRWIINDEYNGAPIYPNTISEDSTVSGQIAGAPYSHYMHIYDSGVGASNNIFNCNYDVTLPSDNFTELTGNVCTLGMTNVTLAFFYTCTGSSTAFGTVYYSINNGPWILANAAQYNNEPRWKYETITNPAFDNVQNIRFGFRWQNNAGSPPLTTSLGLDDLQLVADFDPASDSLLVTNVFPNPVCRNTYLQVYWSLEHPLCDGTYAIELSDNTGNFANPVVLGVTNISNMQITGVAWVLIPSATFPGTCYRVRIRRMYPAPIFIGYVSACFTIQACPNTVTTCPGNAPPVVVMDTNAVCAGSVIDVPFYSTGAYALNTYILQLSDASGSFANPTNIGSLPSDITYDPANPTPGYPPPGSVGGLIPDTVTGSCNYYIRIIADGPNPGPGWVYGNAWGPFCIQHCDIITNNEQDITICIIPTTDTVCVNIDIDINFYDSTTVYSPGNQFMIQLISRGPIPPPFTQVGALGALGSITAINDTTLRACIGPLSALLAAGIPPGSYYMRIVATNTNFPDSIFGSMIRITIGVPANLPGTINAVDWNTFQPVDSICSGDLVYFYLVPNPNPASTYRWYSNQLQGSPITQNALLVNFAGFSGVFSVYVRENSFGCLGPPTPVFTLYVQGLPNVNISPPAVVCVGDTVQYSVPFVSGTYWSWWLTNGSMGTIVDTSNNVIKIVFNTAGIDSVFCQGLNYCGLKTGFRKITVRDYPAINARPDTTVCSGSPVTLVTDSGTAYLYEWRNGTALIGTNNDSVLVYPTSNSVYTLHVSNGGACHKYDTVYVTVEQSVTTPFTDSLCIGGSTILDAQTASATAYLWDDSSTAAQLTVNDTGTYSVLVSVTGEICPRTYTYTLSYAYPDTASGTTYFCYGDSVALIAQSSGISYLWDNGDTTAMIVVTDSGDYSVIINDTSRLCARVENYSVKLLPPDTCNPEIIPVFTIPNVFTPNSDGLNDFFHGLTDGAYNKFLVKIYNRWGELMFESTDQYFQWDGKNQSGKDAPEGVYYYIGRLEHPADTRNLHGFVTLIRDK